jgi:hypothetical protein
MNRLEANTEGFVQYGISSDLAERAAREGLTVTKARALSLKDMVEKFSLTPGEARVLKESVQRQAIEKDTLYTLLERSNYTCNICRGVKSSAFIVHHIKPYAKTQDNEYANLIVLCPNDHDLAHGSGLTMSISEEQLHRAKERWETQVEKANAAKAAQAVEINEGAIDYINIRRIEELCMQLFGKIPPTRATANLLSKGIIDAQGSFQQKYVRTNLSGGKFLFDYINSGEALHYRDLMVEIAKQIHFEDLSAAVDEGARRVAAFEGRYAFFIGGVYSKRPDLPITTSTPEVLMHYTKRKIRVEWILDPNFFFSVSAISRQGSKNRYIIYCLVRTVDADSTSGQVLVKASPLLIAQPSTYANRIPAIGWQDRYSHLIDEEAEASLDEPEDLKS